MSVPMWSDVAQAVVLDGSTVVAYEYRNAMRTQYYVKDDDGRLTRTTFDGGYNWLRSDLDVHAVFASGYRMQVATLTVEGEHGTLDATARDAFREWVTQAARLDD